MNFEARLRKVETAAGLGRAPTEEEFRAALALIRRHFEVVVLPELFGISVDEDELAAMRAVADSGQLDGAYQTQRRYWRARGVDYDAQTRRICGEVREVLYEALRPKEAADDCLH